MFSDVSELSIKTNLHKLTEPAIQTLIHTHKLTEPAIQTHLYVPTIHCGESALWGKSVRPSWSLWGTYTHTSR